MMDGPLIATIIFGLVCASLGWLAGLMHIVLLYPKRIDDVGPQQPVEGPVDWRLVEYSEQEQTPEEYVEYLEAKWGGRA